jgi:small-conductance mechanosensitive channel
MQALIPYLLAFFIVITTLVLVWLFNRFMRRFIKKSSLVLENDPTNYQFLRYAVSMLFYLIGFGLAIYTIPSLKNIAQSMLAGAGIAAVAVSFASQAALSNIIAGVFIVIFKPFRVNDRVTIKDTMTGIVEDITLRHTVIRNFQNRRVIIPNSIISDEVIVNSDLVETKVCQWIEMGISYNSDIDLARKIMIEEVEAHPFVIDNRTEEEIENGEPKIPVRVVSLGESSVNLRAWAWGKDSADAFRMQCELLESIKKRFDKEGIEIPFPHRTLYIRQQSPKDTSSTDLLDK